MLKHFAAVLALFLSACAGYGGQTLVRVHIDTKFSDGEQTAIRQEITVLSAAFQVAFKEVPEGAAALYVRPINVPDRGELGNYTSYTDTAQINLDADFFDLREFQDVVGHEIGHWLGLRHSCQACSDLMSATTSPGRTGSVQLNDIKQFNAIWHP